MESPALVDASYLVFFISLAVGAALILLCAYLLRKSSRGFSGKSTGAELAIGPRNNGVLDGSPSSADSAEEQKIQDSKDSSDMPAATSTAATSKRVKNKKRREAQQEFTHSWMVGALKGHTKTVFDMDFSNNGKLLASCGEDGLRPEEEVLDPGERNDDHQQSMTPRPGESSGANFRRSDEARTKGEDAGASAPGQKEDRAILSRRQRKNRTRTPRDQRRDEEHEEQRHRRHQHSSRGTLVGDCPNARSSSNKNNGACSSSRKKQSSGESRRAESNGDGEPKENARRSRKSFTSSQREQLHHLSDAHLASLLRRYTLTYEQLAHLGYPVECSFIPGYAVIVNHHQHPIGHRARHHHLHHHHHHRLDANAREFVPGSAFNGYNMVESEADSGNGSGSSVENSDLEPESASDSDKSSDILEPFSSSSSSSSSVSYAPREETKPAKKTNKQITERTCARCHKSFYIKRDSGQYLEDEHCVYHWGKLRSGMATGSHYNIWECCKGRDTSRGCTTARMHVWTGLRPGYNGPFNGYVRTRPASVVPEDGNYGVYALDCEMCFTRNGLELVKVTVVGMDGKVVYDTLVRPDAEVIDYNTRFSGITAKDLSRATKSLRDVQEDITSFVHAETILIGHGLENDLRALRILHSTVIDTCVAFPHFLGYPFRSSLKTLARTVLRREIQVSVHDSVEDARIAVDLMLRRLQHDLL